MEAVVITDAGCATVLQIKRCSPELGELLVRCEAAAICTVERQIFSGARRVYPAIGGHEVSGVVEQCEDPQSEIQPGDRVVLDSVHRCRQCIHCLTGDDHVCTELRKTRKRYDGFIRIGGGFAEFTTISARQAVKIPPLLRFEEASLVEPLACCIHSITKSRLRSEDTVVVLGAGVMGIMHVLLSKLQGARVIVSDPENIRLQLVQQLGADVTLNPRWTNVVADVRELTDGRGADAVFVTADTVAAGEQGLAMAAPLGRVVFFASTQPPLSLAVDWNRLHYDEICVTGAAGKTELEFREAVQLLGSGRIDLKPLITRLIPLHALPEELASTPTPDTWRVVVRHGSKIDS
jgi:threonine dehydrogenase-like Zn-dependent dehydrogenase